MKTVIITGSSAGIGLGLARELIKRECNVVLTSHVNEELNAAYEAMVADFGADRVMARVCDVTEWEQVSALWEAAVERFGAVDIWINNAGVTSSTRAVWEVAPAQMRRVVETNLLGTMYGVNVAMQGMTRQGHGAIYNFYGHGSWDELRPPNFATYGITKRAIRYFTEALIEETRGGPVLVGWLMPGVVLTDLIFTLLRTMPDQEREQVKKMINVIGDTVETVTPWLAEQVLTNRDHGAGLNYMPPEKNEARKKDPFYLNRDLFADIDI